MKRAYKILFRVRLLHGYYTDGITPDFVVVPTPETSRWLKDNNMLFRKDDTGFRVFYTADTTAAAPFTPFDAVRLRFMLLLEHPTKFFNITNLTIGGETYRSANILEFVNDGNDPDLNEHLIERAEPHTFTYEFPQVSEDPSEDVGKIELFNEQNEPVPLNSPNPDPDNVLPASNGRFFYPLDLTGYPVGVYRFKTYVNDEDEEEQSIYIDGQLKRMSGFGMVHIDLPPSSVSFDTGVIYDAVFTAKTPYWRYLMIMKNTSVGEKTFAVVDDTEEYTFTQKADTEVNGIQTLVYDSDQLIPLSEQPVSTLSFVDVSGETPTEVLGSLSNPVVNIITDLSPDHPEITQIYVYV